MSNLVLRLAKLEGAAGMGKRPHSHVIQATAGGQSMDAVREQVERVCRENGIQDRADSTLIILRRLIQPSAAGPVPANSPIRVYSIDGRQAG